MSSKNKTSTEDHKSKNKDKDKNTENAANLKSKKESSLRNSRDRADRATPGVGEAVKRTAQTTGRTVADSRKQVVSGATTAWAEIRGRKAASGMAGAGAAVVTAAAVFAQHRFARRRRGPLARLTGGRLGS